jgi:hypothetical protein
MFSSASIIIEATYKDCQGVEDFVTLTWKNSNFPDASALGFFQSQIPPEAKGMPVHLVSGIRLSFTPMVRLFPKALILIFGKLR